MTNFLSFCNAQWQPLLPKQISISAEKSGFSYNIDNAGDVIFSSGFGLSCLDWQTIALNDFCQAQSFGQNLQNSWKFIKLSNIENSDILARFSLLLSFIGLICNHTT